MKVLAMLMRMTIGEKKRPNSNELIERKQVTDHKYYIFCKYKIEIIVMKNWVIIRKKTPDHITPSHHGID